MENYKLALIGHPLGHSLSPVLYKTAFKQLGLEGSYELLDTPPEDLISRIKYLKNNGYYGFNVTIPFKVPLTLFLSKYDELMNITGSVNTVKIEEDGTLSGFNTDVYGFMQAIPDDIDLTNKKAAVMGTGGASRAICAGLFKKGIRKIDIYTRNIIDSSETVKTLRERFNTIEFNAIQSSMMKGLEDVDILVNATPLGMKNFAQGSSPVEDKFIQTLSDSAIVYDIVYNPIRTSLISKAIKYNKKYIHGLDMLVWQAVRATEIWTGQKPDFNLMKTSALEAFLMR